MAGAWLKALKGLTKKIPTDEDIDLMVREIIDEKHDRGAALVAATLLEESLRGFLKSRMIRLSRTEEEALFERDAPLSTFSKIIRVAYAFGMIDDKLRRECDYIREIRNAFAHVPKAITFDTPEIKEACFLLTRYYDKLEGLDPDHPKTYYIGAITHMTVLLNNAKQSPTTTRFPISLG